MKVGNEILTVQGFVQKWGWSLAIGREIELRDDQDRFVTSGYHRILRVVKNEAVYRAKGGE